MLSIGTDMAPFRFSFHHAALRNVCCALQIRHRLGRTSCRRRQNHGHDAQVRAPPRLLLFYLSSKLLVLPRSFHSRFADVHWHTTSQQVARMRTQTLATCNHSPELRRCNFTCHLSIHAFVHLFAASAARCRRLRRCRLRL